jgi:thiol-disulfide isomerase/thioredoxin
MRHKGAPEVRGSQPTTRRRLAGSLALPILSLSALAISLLLSPYGHVEATTALEASQRELRLAANEAKPAFALADLEGARQDLNERAGQVVLVHFFATWCEPCREELPSLSRLVQTQPGERLSVLAVNVGEVPARVQRFLEATPVEFPVLLDADRAVTKAWGVSVLPTTFVLDRGLVARLFVEGDLDWLRPDVLAALESVGAENPKKK